MKAALCISLVMGTMMLHASQEPARNNEVYFVTGNAGKFSEVRDLWNNTFEGRVVLRQENIDLPEIQEVDPQAVVEAKLDEAQKHLEGCFFIEDTSLFLDALTNGQSGKGLPGPLIKWFMKTVGNEGLIEQAGTKRGATAVCTLGLCESDGTKHFFTGKVRGTIALEPRAEGNGFSWDPIFIPEGQSGEPKTFAQMSSEQKAAYSMRGKATTALLAYLSEKDGFQVNQ